VTLSIRTRLTLWYVAVLALVLTAFGVGVLWLQTRFSRSQFDEELSTLGATVSSALRGELSESHDLPRAASETRNDFNIPNRTIAILDGDGRPVAAHWRGFRRADLPRPDGDRTLTTTVVQGNRRWRVRVQREESVDGTFAVAVAASEDMLVRERSLLIKALLVGAPGALVLAAIVCWWTASRAMRPLIHMSEQAEVITLNSLDTRLRGPDRNDEVGQLRRAFNRLLDRVAAGVATQRRFMADASHELRTPISAARTAAEVTLARPHRGEDEYRDALTIVAGQTTRLGRMVDDMLVLARVDAGGHRIRPHQCLITDVMAECAEVARVLCVAKGVAFEARLEPAISCEIDEALVRQLALNLLENAVNYTAEGGGVALALRAGFEFAEIVVTDTGCGIPASDRDRIFERFVRLDEARRAEGGAGLGLPIARWIAEAHHGSLWLEASGPSGSTFVARLPHAIAPARAAS